MVRRCAFVWCAEVREQARAIPRLTTEAPSCSLDRQIGQRMLSHWIVRIALRVAAVETV